MDPDSDAVRLEKDPHSDKAKPLQWSRIVPTEDTLPGVYCLRTNQAEWDERTLWQTYTMLTDLESVFRSLKSELDLRPIYHHKSVHGSMATCSSRCWPITWSIPCACSSRPRASI